MSVAVVFHHGGEFVSDFLLYYKGGKENRFNEIDKDKWCYFEATGILKDLGYDDHLKYKLWWYINEDDKYVRIIDDNDTDNIAEYVANNKCEAHIYVEHSVIGTIGGNVGVRSVESVDASGVEAGNGWSTYVEGGPSNVSVGVGDDEVSDDGFESSEDEAAGIRLDDSEEERALGLDDGFEGDAEDAPSATGTKGPSTVVGTSLNVYGGNVGPSTASDDLEIGYISEQLGSSDPDASDDEQAPAYDTFKMEELTASYKFKVGLEFKSLVEFKEAIIEWNVLNGFEIKYEKNDKIRVRAICKDKKGICGFLAFVSQVGDKHTFRMKRWIGDHTCARKTNNRSATAKWVSKAVLKKMATSDDGAVSCSSIVTDMRTNHAVGITMNRAWRAKKIAKEKLEGDAAKQYNLLWRYSAELKRVNNGNNCKINVERLGPQLQPKFSSFYFCFDGTKKGFTTACRPFIGVDGCHLKTKYGGTLLIAVGRDPNDQYYPIAFGVSS